MASNKKSLLLMWNKAHDHTRVARRQSWEVVTKVLEKAHVVQPGTA